MTPRLAPLLALALLLSGCAGLSESAREDLTVAAVGLGDQLEPPGLLAATAALVRESEGAYPLSPFDLLGSRAATETGLRRLGLSALALAPEEDGLRIRYALLPTASDPSTRYGSLLLRPGDEAGTYVADLLMEREADPDVRVGTARPGRLPLAREGDFAVVRARGQLCLDVDVVRERAGAGERVGEAPMTERATYTVTFTPADGAPAPEALADGLTVTLPR